MVFSNATVQAHTVSNCQYRLISVRKSRLCVKAILLRKIARSFMEFYSMKLHGFCFWDEFKMNMVEYELLW